MTKRLNLKYGDLEGYPGEAEGIIDSVASNLADKLPGATVKIEEAERLAPEDRYNGGLCEDQWEEYVEQQNAKQARELSLDILIENTSEEDEQRLVDDPEGFGSEVNADVEVDFAEVVEEDEEFEYEKEVRRRHDIHGNKLPNDEPDNREEDCD